MQAIRVSLKQMIASTETAEPNQAAAGESDFYGLVNTLSNTIKTLKVNIAEPDRLVTNVKAIVTSNNNVIALTEGLIANAEPATKARLAEMLQTMKVQAEKVLQGGRALNTKFEDNTLQAKLLHEVSVLETQANQLLADAGEAFSINSLRYYAKSAAAGIVKLAAMSRSALRVMPDNDAKNILAFTINTTLSEVSELVPVIAAAGKNPHNKRYQIDLLKASVKALAKFAELVLATKRGGRYITDPNLKQDLAFCSNEIVELNKKLETACSSVADLGGQREIEEALEVFLNVNSDLEALQVTDGKQTFVASRKIQLLTTVQLILLQLVKFVTTPSSCSTWPLRVCLALLTNSPTKSESVVMSLIPSKKPVPALVKSLLVFAR